LRSVGRKSDDVVMSSPSQKMKNYFLAAVFSLATLFLALDGLTSIVGDLAPINLFWGFLCGVGWYLARELGGGTFGQYVFFWGKIWPFFLMPISITYFFGKVLSRNPHHRNRYLLLATVSLFILFPRQFASQHIKDVPTLFGILSSIY
jgi:hypothetical protein